MAGLLRTSLATGVGVGAISTVIPVSIWPGEAKLTAPLFCSPPYREPIVVSDTTHDSEGTSTNYTLYCVSDRGAVTDAGFLCPFLVLLAAHVLAVTAVAAVAGLRSRHRDRRRPGDRVDDPPPDGHFEY
ncbi:hypothetical protein [Nocardia aurantia]|uniref:Uncharacterized protein n=1 Tax=Nocardia aurantia TaxID=2585199 RepID=A0A7K0DVS1_9NOCA|nr:hypothetical protein [Nocardia aurantia]MQY28924.1 hypothetical protein [Nocardia aurantia]